MTEGTKHTEFYDGGQVKETCVLKDGKLDGEVVSYAETGGVLQRANFKEGKLDGESLTYDDEGKLAQKASFKDGRLDGQMIIYAEGKVQAALSFVGGKQAGEALLYDENGNLVQRALYARGKLNGLSMWYDADGVLIKKAQFREGKLEGVTIEYYSDGKVYKASQYKANKLEGEAVTYSPEGKVKERAYYSAGKLAPPPAAARGSLRPARKDQVAHGNAGLHGGDTSMQLRRSAQPVGRAAAKSRPHGHARRQHHGQQAAGQHHAFRYVQLARESRGHLRDRRGPRRPDAHALCARHACPVGPRLAHCAYRQHARPQ
ncbi:MAG TPA: toxin-antitoxin system YwqK family antitoxin [Pyrinomonadaceae bacterium]|nr:toxin-antitoxin system YwqK family antitoxin [Pyrinomonadaceae bacterium]